MTEHTKLPWRFSPWHVEEGPSAVRTGSDYPEDFIVCTTASDADAAFIVKACNSHEALVKALRECVQDIVFSERVRDPSFNPRALGAGTVLGDAIAALDAVDSAAHSGAERNTMGEM